MNHRNSGLTKGSVVAMYHEKSCPIDNSLSFIALKSVTICIHMHAYVVRRAMKIERAFPADLYSWSPIATAAAISQLYCRDKFIRLRGTFQTTSFSGIHVGSASYYG